MKYSYLIQIICTQSYSYKYSYFNTTNKMVSSNYFYSIVICLNSYMMSND